MEDQNDEILFCEVCAKHRANWADDDGVLRCDPCHSEVATAWGGDYGDLKCLVHLIKFN